MFVDGECIELLRDIRDYLMQINSKLDFINDSLSDIKGEGIYNIEDLHSELLDIKRALEEE